MVFRPFFPRLPHTNLCTVHPRRLRNNNLLLNNNNTRAPPLLLPLATAGTGSSGRRPRRTDLRPLLHRGDGGTRWILIVSWSSGTIKS